MLATTALFVVCLGFALGSTTGRGVEAWKEFGAHIQVYRSTWSADLIGVDTLFLSGPSFKLGGERRTVPGVKADLERRRPARIAVAGALLGLLAVAMWRATLAESVVLGIVAIFALTPAPAYYWIMALLIPLRRGRAAALALLLLSAALHALHMVYPYSDEAAWRFGLLAWGYALILISWLVPDLVAVVRERREPQSG